MASLQSRALEENCDFHSLFLLKSFEDGSKVKLKFLDLQISLIYASSSGTLEGNYIKYYTNMCNYICLKANCNILYILFFFIFFVYTLFYLVR